ncbi:hypothetical Protein YC6258_05387 [Gynuella sunshinyii YC6258]|uniref:Uncharacterized protein n=1 Tax=Gynuella sunshinyii YC6258 TaxID=1445510 RepID=A0A0C5VRZ3_9GAMM|nr:hypothetical Protein YC6258_05387 [Gynuella sunshinyii YC6258]
MDDLLLQVVQSLIFKVSIKPISGCIPFEYHCNLTAFAQNTGLVCLEWY